MNAGEPYNKPGEKKIARTSAETIAKVQEMLGTAPEVVEEAILEADAAVMAEIAPEFERDAFCMRNCDPPTIGHHYQCGFYKKEEATDNSRNIIPAPDSVSPVGEKPTPPMEIPRASIVSIDGFLRFNIEVQISVAEMATWPSHKITDFWDGVRKVLAATKPDRPLR
jgi:hypothetical protein